jgi:hypothetical protein
MAWLSNIALGDIAASQCALVDSNGDDMVVIDEIITAMNVALSDCSSLGMPTEVSNG